MAFKFYIVSPREPSGVTWLVNCFLELGIKTYRGNDPNWMWEKNDDFFCLNPAENALKKWLPILSTREKFTFKSNIEARWMHEWPDSRFADGKIIYFIRDPRDSIYSRYKREKPNVAYKEFVSLPDSKALLDRIDTWRLFNESWLSFADFDFFRFEDYKNNAEELLIKILKYIDFNYESHELQSAIVNSTSSKASNAEREYFQNNPQDTEQVNRGGLVGSWRDFDDSDLAVVRMIESRCCSIMNFFGYTISYEPYEVSNVPIANNFFLNYSFFEKLTTVRRDKLIPLLKTAKLPVFQTDLKELILSDMGAQELMELRISIEDYLGGIHEDYNRTFIDLADGHMGDFCIRELVRLRCNILFGSNNVDYEYVLVKELIKKTLRLILKTTQRMILRNIAGKSK